MRDLKVLDVTLRDGGCVNNFNFGQQYMKKILQAQEEAGIEIIEMGYLDEKNGSETGRTQYLNEQVIKTSILKEKKKNIIYVAMMDYGKFNVDNLKLCDNKGIDGIRIAFHKKDRFNIIPLGKKIIEKGYKLFIQPMITLRYSDRELLEFIDIVNSELPNASGFYIVDSFGEIRPNDMSRILNLVDYNLNPSITLGFHSHNNLQLSYSNAIAMLQFPTNRSFILDSSIMGMGKGAGNLNTELLLEHLNLYYGKKYKIPPLLDVIDKVINQLHTEYYWGYAPEYYLSSANHCTPSYASYFYNKHMLPIDQVNELLSIIQEEKKISFDKDYAEKIYREYNDRKVVDDTEIINELTKEFLGKVVLIVAPGRSILDYKEKINELCHNSDIISIGLNITSLYEFNYIFTTRKECYEIALKQSESIIVPSNIVKSGRGNVKVLNYGNWVNVNGENSDSSGVMVLNLLKKCKVNKILLAGFDGFSIDINKNYYDANLRHPVSVGQADNRNSYYSKFIRDIREDGVYIEFITPSKYEE